MTAQFALHATAVCVVRATVGIIATVLILGACGGRTVAGPSTAAEPTVSGQGGSTPDTSAPTSNSTVTVLTAEPAAIEMSMAALFEEAVIIDGNGCVSLGEYGAVWPPGTYWDYDADGLRLSDGALVPLGGKVEAGGGVPGPPWQSFLDGPSRDLAERCNWTGDVVLMSVVTPDKDGSSQVVATTSR